MNTFRDLLQQQSSVRLPIQTVRELFLKAHPECVEDADRDGRLRELLLTLQSDGTLRLPAAGSTKGWAAYGARLPLWVMRTNASATPPRKLALAVEVPWLPVLQFWPTLTASQRELAAAINAFLMRYRANRWAPLKERSLQIFGDEKRLDALLDPGGDTLFAGRLPLKALHTFVAPPPLPLSDVVCPGAPLLVVENHNAFWSFSQWYAVARQFSAVAYGQGSAFIRSGLALARALERCEAEHAYYFGDIDGQGLAIPVEFNRRTDNGGRQVLAAVALYEWLLEHGHRRLDKAFEPEEAHLQWLGGALKARVLALAADGWMPQESLGVDALEDHFPSVRIP